MLTACHVLTTGYCRASESHLIRGGARRTVDVPAQVALLHHATRGWLLFDAGYASRLWDATARPPYFLYRRATPLRLPPELPLAAQLPTALGLSPADVRTVVVSHFHADHVAGLRDFPRARLVASRAAYADVAGRRGWPALRRAFLPLLMPGDFADRATLVDDFSGGPDLPHLGPTRDLFGDGTLLLVPLPGHARGQIGLYAETPETPTLFLADSAYRTRSVRENLPPHPLTDLFADDPRAARDTLTRLHAFHRARPDVRLVASHEEGGGEP